MVKINTLSKYIFVFTSECRQMLINHVFFFTVIVAAISTGCAATSSLIDQASTNTAVKEKVAINKDFTDFDFAIDLQNKNDITKAENSGLTRSQILIRGGIKLMIDGKFDKAMDVLNAALTFDIENGLLHFLNGYAYHQLYLRGESNYLNLAEVGYKTAASKDASLIGISYSQLGELYLHSAQYSQAEKYLEIAIRKGRRSSKVLYDFARASALNGHLKKSRSTIAELDSRKWTNPLLLKAKAIQAAALSDYPEARRLSLLYAKTAKSDDVNYVNYRINQIFNSVSRGDVIALNETNEEQSAGYGAEPEVQVTGEESVPEVGSNDVDTKEKTSNSEKTDKPELKKNIAKWSRCDTDTQISVQMNGSSTTDEYDLAPTLPQACPGEIPRSAIVEITMLQSFQVDSASSGINILDGLTSILTLGNTNTLTNDGSGLATTTAGVRSWLLANGASTANVTYSLNIANAGLNRAEIMSRPGVTVIDRVPSIFFAGQNISLGIAPAVINSTPTIVDKTIGVSLAVTPTFVDDDNVLVSARMTQSAIAGALLDVPEALLQQTRNSMLASAVMKFNETIVVNGLRQKSEGRLSSGVPILKDLPLIQYLFKNTVVNTTTFNFITFLTLRSPDQAKGAKDYEDFQKLETNLKGYIKFTARDFDGIGSDKIYRLERMVRDLKRMVWF